MSLDHAPEDRATHDPDAKLVTMANQIARFFETQPTQDGATEVAAHIRQFWAPQMRNRLLRHLDAGGAGLSALAHDGAIKLKG